MTPDMMKQKRRTFFMLTVFAVVGFMLFLYGLIVALMMEAAGWHTPVLVGGTAVAAYFVYLIDRAGLLWDLVIRPVRVPLQYAIYAAIGVIIEFIGQHLLGWWSYPAFSPALEVVHVIVFGYPFLFFMLFEMYVLAQWLLRSVWLAVPAVWVVTIVIHEGPNLVAHQWVYTTPFGEWAIAGVHLFVLVGWLIPVVLPLVVRYCLSLPTYVPRLPNNRDDQ